MIICAFENSPSIPSFLVTKIVYIRYGQLKKRLLFLLPFHSCAPCRAHQTRRSGRNSRPISAEVALPRLQSEIKVAWFLFASHSFLANNLRFMVKLIVKTIVINRKIHKNKRKRFYSSNKEGLICWCKFVLTKFQVNIKSQILKYTNRLLLLLDYCLGLSHHRQVTSTTWIKAPKCVYTIKNNKNRNHCACLGCQTL